MKSSAVWTAAFLLAATPAAAHAVLSVKEGEAGQYYVGTIRISHGCEGSPTTMIAVQIPESVVIAKPQPKPGWTVDIEKAPLAKPAKTRHGETNERVATIRWRGGSLSDDMFDEFGLLLLLPDGPGPLHLPVIQTCKSGEMRWTEIPQSGQSASTLRRPAPMIQVTQGSSFTLGSIMIDAPWARATPPGAKTAVIYATIKNDGKADKLVHAETDFAKVEFHKSSMKAEIMKMAALDVVDVPEKGLVTFEPGGLHFMLTELRRPLKGGETFPLTLKFAKAGQVTVIVRVVPLGADGASAHRH